MEDRILLLIRALYVGFFVGTLAFLLLWEGGRPRATIIGMTRRQHVVRNLVMLFWVIVIADYLVGEWLLDARGFLAGVPPVLLDGAALPLPAQFLLGFIASDLLDYLLHLAGHRYDWLWRLHSVHHSDPFLDATTAGRTHPLETSIGVVAKIGLYWLLGLPLWIEGVRAVLHNPIAMIQHANVNFPGWLERLRPVLVTPAMHRLHHAEERAYHDRNLGVIFSFWDHLFGTAVAAGTAASGRVGLAGYFDERWQTVAGMLATPVRTLPRSESKRRRELPDQPLTRS